MHGLLEREIPNAPRKRESSLSPFRLIVTSPAVELEPYPGSSLIFVEHPFTRFHRRTVTNMLVVTAREQRAPVTLIVRLKANYLLFHWIVFTFSF